MSPINRKTWYYFALFLPLLFPLALLYTDEFLSPQINYTGLHPALRMGFEFIRSIGFYLCSAVIFGGIQYLVFLAGVIWWGRRKTSDDFGRYAWLLPILFTPICGLGLALQLTPQGTLLNRLNFGLSIALFSLPIGYFYVGVTVLLTRILQAIGWITS